METKNRAKRERILDFHSSGDTNTTPNEWKCVTAGCVNKQLFANKSDVNYLQLIWSADSDVWHFNQRPEGFCLLFADKKRGDIKDLIKYSWASELNDSWYFIDRELDPKWSRLSEPITNVHQLLTCVTPDLAILSSTSHRAKKRPN